MESKYIICVLIKIIHLIYNRIMFWFSLSDYDTICFDLVYLCLSSEVHNYPICSNLSQTCSIFTKCVRRVFYLQEVLLSSQSMFEAYSIFKKCCYLHEVCSKRIISPRSVVIFTKCVLSSRSMFRLCSIFVIFVSTYLKHTGG